MDKENKYSIISSLKKYVLEIKKADNEIFDILLSEIKSYIAEIDILKEEFNKKLQQYYSYSETEEYNKYIDEFYKLLLWKCEKEKNIEYDFMRFKCPSETEGSLKPFYPIVSGFLWNLLSPQIQEDIINKHLGILDFYMAIVTNLFRNDKEAIFFRLAECKSRINTDSLDFYIFANEECFNKTSMPEFCYTLWRVAAIKVLENLIDFMTSINTKAKSTKKSNLFTDRENELIGYIEQGFSTYKELEQKMSLSPRGIKQHLENINNKLASKGTGIKALKTTLRNRR